jgi:site-specific recombinase XerD
MSALAPVLESFFSERLLTQCRVSSHTVSAYRDTFRLLLLFVSMTTGRMPATLNLEDLDARLIGAFLDHLEHVRGNAVRTRNARLAAIHSFYRYAALRHPEHAAVIGRVLAIPPKRFNRAVVSFLTDDEVKALLAGVDRGSWLGRRDHALLLLAVQTGLRVSELTSLTCGDIVLGASSHVRCLGKGRKERTVPLTAETAAVTKEWIDEVPGESHYPLFPTRQGAHLSRYGVSLIVARHVEIASSSCTSLAKKTVSPHVLRHTCAMRLLHAGVETTVIALWLGHEAIASTQMYVHADMTLKERAIARTAPIAGEIDRYRPPDRLLAFLERL